jgi:hypothetical protein
MKKIHSKLSLAAIDTASPSPRSQYFLKTHVFYGRSTIFIYPLKGEVEEVFLFVVEQKLQPLLGYELKEGDLQLILENISRD